MGSKFVQHGKINIKILRFKDGRSLLEIDQRGIRDITEVIGLNQLQDLEELNLSKNKISEITGLENLRNLKKLNLSENQIKDINGLENLTNLRELDISYNKITDSQTLRKLKENHINLTNIDLRGNPCFNPLIGLRTEILKQNPSKSFILPDLFELQLNKEEIEYDPKEEWRYLSDTEFCDIIGECLKLNHMFFMDSLYTDFRLMMKREFGENRIKLLEKRILEEYCLYDGEQILFEFEGEINQVDDILNDIRASVTGGTIYITNYRIIAQGTLNVMGHSAHAKVWGGPYAWALSGGSKRDKTKENIIDGSAGQELPCYGYQFKRKNPIGIEKTSMDVRYSVQNDDLQMRNSDSTLKQRITLLKAKRDITITPPKELLDELYENLREILNNKQIIDGFQKKIDMGVNKKIKSSSFLEEIQNILQEKERLSNSDKLEIILGVYELDPIFFMASIYPKMLFWNFPSFLNIKGELTENLNEKFNNEQIIDGFRKVIDMEDNKKIKIKSILEEIQYVLQDKERFSDSDKKEIILGVYDLDPEFFITSIYPKLKRWKFPAFLKVKDDIFEKLSLSEEH
ncbi:MAG: leucine-rich repeat domain-containing protein [Promethearchaeota archaeon]